MVTCQGGETNPLKQVPINPVAHSNTSTLAQTGTSQRHSYSLSHPLSHTLHIPICRIKCLKLTSMYATMSTKTHPRMYSVTPLIPAMLYINKIIQTAIYAFIYIHTEQVCIDNTLTTNQESHSFADERRKKNNQLVFSLSFYTLSASISKKKFQKKMRETKKN